MSVIEKLDRLVHGVPIRDLTNAQRRRVWFPQGLMAQFLAEAEHYEPHETGGAVLGYEVAASFVVRDLVAGGPRACRRRGSFLPDDDWQIPEIARRYERSGRLHAYLGEVHSHPDGRAAPSRTDRRTTRRIAEHTPARAPRALMVIAARESRTWTLAAWHYAQGVIVPARVLVASDSVFQ